MRIYQAGPLFSQAERQWHRRFKKQLEEAGHEVLWPGDLIEGEEIQAWGQEAPRRIMETDRDALLLCDVLVALLDGPQVDDGTAWEIGYACARDIPVVGIRTDTRLCGDTMAGKVNAMIQGSVLCLVRTPQEVIEILKTLSPSSGND